MAGPFIALSALTFNVTEKIYENYLVKRWQEHLLFILSVLSWMLPKKKKKNLDTKIILYYKRLLLYKMVKERQQIY